MRKTMANYQLSCTSLQTLEVGDDTCGSQLKIAQQHEENHMFLDMWRMPHTCDKRKDTTINPQRLVD